MFTGRVASSTPNMLQNTITVVLEILDDVKVVETRTLGFDGGIMPEELKKEITKFVDNYNAEFEQIKKQKEQDDHAAQLEKVAGSVRGIIV